ncbi:MAG: contractile injection system tape measure protein [Crocinitomicaceae bacterium]|nr:contractile injection system tape measure protein [Crocinitomicaceae bacterium]
MQNNELNHIIKSQTFQLDLSDRERTSEFFDRVKTVYYNSAIAIIDRILTENSVDGKTFKLDLVELDLGTINPDNFEYELGLRLEEALLEFFRGAFAPNGQLKVGTTVTQGENFLKQFDTFLKNGHFDWNVKTTLKAVDLADTLINNSPSEVASIINKNVGYEDVRRRIIFQFDDETISDFVRLSKGSIGEEILGYRQEINKDQSKHKRVDASEDKFRVALWDITLAYLYLEVSSYHGRKQFLSFYFRKIAHRYKLDYESLLKTVFQGINKYSEKMSVDADFAEIIKELMDEFDLPDQENAALNSYDFEAIRFGLDYVFTRGIFLSDSSLNNFQSLNERIALELKKRTTETIAFFEDVINDISKRRNLLLLLNSENINFISERAENKEISERREIVDHILGMTDGSTDLKRRILPILEGEKGTIILTALTANPYDKSYVYNYILKSVLDHTGLEREVKSKFRRKLWKSFSTNERHKLKSISALWKEHDELDLPKEKGLKKIVHSKRNDVDLLQDLFDHYSKNNFDKRSLITSLIELDFEKNHAITLVSKLELSLKLQSEFRKEYLKSDSSFLRSMKILAQLNLDSLENWSMHYSKLLNHFNDIISKEQEASHSLDIIKKELEIFKARWKVFNDEFYQRASRELERSNAIKTKRERRDQEYILTAEQENRIKSLLINVDNFSTKKVADVLEKVADEIGISSKEVTRLIYKSLIKDYSLSGLSASYPAASIEELYNSISKIQFEQDEHNITVFNKLRAVLPDLSNAAADELKEVIEKRNAAQNLISPLKTIIQAYDQVNDDNQEAQENIEFRLLQHWLIQTEKTFSGWNFTKDQSKALLQEIKLLSKEQKVSFKSLSDQIIKLLKTRTLLNPFQNDLLNLLIKESEEILLKKDIEKDQSAINTNLVEAYILRGYLPDWYQKNDLDHIIDLIRNEIKTHPKKIATLFNQISNHKEIFRKDNFLKLIRVLNENHIQRFYQNVIIAEKFFEQNFKSLYGVTENTIQFLRRRILLHGIETSFNSESETFFKRLKFMSHRKTKLPEKSVERMIYYAENNLNRRSPNLIFWNARFESKEDLVEELKNEAQGSDFSISWIDLLTDKRPLSADQSEIFKRLSTLIRKDIIESEAFYSVLNDEIIRKKLVENSSKNFIFEIIQPKLNSRTTNSVKHSLSLLEKYQNILSIKQSKELEENWLNAVLRLLAHGTIQNLNPEEWKTLFYRTLNITLGKKGLEELTDKSSEFDEEEKKLITQTKEEVEKVKNEEETIEEEETKEDLGNIFVKNAGVVILAPYFTRLFDRIGLLSNGAFTDEDARAKAICCTHFLATGKLPEAENELVLNKILCGADIRTSINLISNVTEEEIEIMNGLLNAITQQWTPLKNTSIEGLRDSFLNRDGRIGEDDEYFYLKVEIKAFDMLIDQLPWSINLIKSSLMTKPLNVEWR